MLDVKYPNAGLAFRSGAALMWRSYEGAGDNTCLGDTGGGGVGITASMDFDPDNNIGVIIVWQCRPSFQRYARGHLSMICAP